MAMLKATARLLEFLPDPMVIVSADAIILYPNKAFAALVELSGDLKGLPLTSVMGRRKSELLDVIKRCCRSAAPLSCTGYIRNARGEAVRCRFQGQLLVRGASKNATTVCLRVISHSSSERNVQKLNQKIITLEREILAGKHAADALHRSQWELSDFFDHANLGLRWVRPDGIIIKVNQTELDLFGYSREEYVGHHIAEFHVDEPVIRDILARLTSAEALHEYPARIRCKDGSVREVLINSSSLFEDGRFIHTRCFTRDITDRTRAEADLRASEARYRQFIHALPAAVYTCDEHGRVTLYNQAAAALWGREPEIGRDLWCGSWKIYRPNGTPLPLDECPMAVTLREGRPIEGEEIIIERPDGTKRHILPHPQPIRNSSGNIAGAVNMLIDITDRERAEEAIAHLASIVTSSDDAIIGKDLRGIVTSWNRGAERVFGYTADEMIGQPVSRLIPPDRHNEEPGILARIAAGESIDHYETIRRRKEGTDFHVSLTVSPVINPQGRIIGASKIARNITEQKRAEQDLQQSREELRRALDFEEAMVSSMGEGLYTVNGQGVVTSINQAAERLFGWSREELLGQNMHDLTHYKHRDGTPFPAEECAALKVLHSGGVLTDHEDVFIRKDGGLFHVVLSSAPIVAGGAIVGLVVVFRDVSERKRHEEALRERDAALTTANDSLQRQAAALAEANKELESFSYSVSHDLRAPLRTIDAFSRIVEDENGPRLNAEGQRCLTIVRKAARQAGELIDDLLELSRLGRQSMQARTVQMTDLAWEAAESLRMMQGSRKVQYRMSDVPACHGDRRLLKLVWANLLENASKYTQYVEAAQIETGWLPDDVRPDAVVYYVKDNGVGFDMKYAHKLFCVFQRLHKKEEFEGTGVGLAIVQRIVHRHGGRVWAEGKAEGGATFYFSLPKAAA
jgi:PAS domain S-box-containing protein